MNKQVQRASSLIAEHYGLRWNNQSLTFRHWKSVGVLSNLFFVSIYIDAGTHLYLVDRSEVSVMDEGLRHKVPCFYFSPQMSERLNRLQHPVWYVVIGDELCHLKGWDLSKLLTRVNIQPGDDARHRFDQEVICPDIPVKKDYLPGRGRCKKDKWHQHLNG